MPALKPLLFGLLAAVLVASLVTDLRARRIYDLVTYPAMAVALALRAWLEGVGELEAGLVSGVVGLALAAGCFGAFAVTGRLGWGDVKLAAVMGASLGYPLVVLAVLAISVFGALQAVMSLLWQGALSDTVRRLLRRRGEGGGAGGPQRHIPYGVAIALGSFWAMWWDANAS